MMLIAVPLTDEDFENRVKEVKEKGADIVELRVDTFSDTSVERVREMLEYVCDVGLRTILTVRSPREGGRHVSNREEILEKLAPLSDYTDIELSSGETISRLAPLMRQHGKKLIISYHDFERTPPPWVIREVLREGYRRGGIPKVAVMAHTLEDVQRLLCAASEEKYEKILISMGEVGRVSRVCAYVFGSVITYASFKTSLAPGQLPLEEMVRLRELIFT